jgi:hypothetical protein
VKDWIVPVLVALIGGALSGGVVPLVQAMRGRGRDRVDAVAALSETARKWVAEFEEEATQARAELRTCRSEAHALADELRALRLAIMHPAATIDGLRELVRTGYNRGGGENGTGVNLRRP